MLKIGDEIKIKSGLKLGYCEKTRGFINNSMLNPHKKVTVIGFGVGSYDYQGSDSFGYCHEWLITDPIKCAQLELDEAKKRVEEAEKKLADLLDPPVVVGQKRASGLFTHEILFIDEITQSATTRWSSSPGKFHSYAHLISTIKAWPIVS